MSTKRDDEGNTPPVRCPDDGAPVKLVADEYDSSIKLAIRGYQCADCKRAWSFHYTLSGE